MSASSIHSFFAARFKYILYIHTTMLQEKLSHYKFLALRAFFWTLQGPHFFFFFFVRRFSVRWHLNAVAYVHHICITKTIHHQNYRSTRIIINLWVYLARYLFIWHRVWRLLEFFSLSHRLSVDFSLRIQTVWCFFSLLTRWLEKRT